MHAREKKTTAGVGDDFLFLGRNSLESATCDFMQCSARLPELRQSYWPRRFAHEVPRVPEMALLGR